MVLHRMADDVGHLDEPAVVLLVQGPQDAALDRLQAVRQVGDGAVADDVGGVVEEAAVDAAMERQLDLAGHKRTRRRRHGDISARTCVAPLPLLAGLGLGASPLPSLGTGAALTTPGVLSGSSSIGSSG